MRSFDTLSRPRPKRKNTGPRIIDAPAAKRKQGGGGFFVLVIILAIGFFGFNSTKSRQPTNTESKNSDTGQSNESTIANLELPQGGLSDDQSLEDLLIIDSPNADSEQQSDGQQDSKDKKQIFEGTIRILNGGASEGSAKELEESLKFRGYEILSSGNANNPHPRTTFYYLPDKRGEAEILADELNFIDIDYVEDPIAQPADILIVLGQNY
ncbi:LytR C-terminal domain-containing protein [Candidatus Berkelbacteria bacterium]|nr:LytR C-terminal domain-containing protein [Candidatus Berkelbacteria bacterium]